MLHIHTGSRPARLASPIVAVGSGASSPSPDSAADTPSPRTVECELNGTQIYAEVRGTGPAVLLVGAADEDAEVFRGIAERLDARTVITYDRRGTRRSGRDDWPCPSALHADDAAELLAVLHLDDAVVLGASAGGIVALQLALRHPAVVRRALVFEPGYFHLVPQGRSLISAAMQAVEDHLTSHRDDWVGASSALGRVVIGTVNPASRGFFAPPTGKGWYADRFDQNAEALIRGDLRLTAEEVDQAALAASATDIRFSFGTASLPIFEKIATSLAAVRGDTPDALEGVGHGVYYHPDEVASYIRVHA